MQNLISVIHTNIIIQIIKKIFADTETTFIFAIISCLTFVTALIVGKYLQNKITEKTKNHQAGITSFIFLKHIIVAIIYLFGFGWALLTLPITKTFAHSLLAGAGATTLILGFATQQLFNNLFSGILLVVNKPFKVNDTIEFQGMKGKVTEINLNSTQLIDENGNTIIIPSSLIINDKLKIIYFKEGENS